MVPSPPWHTTYRLIFSAHTLAIRPHPLAIRPHPLAIRPHPLAIRPRAYRPSLRASTFREHSALDLIPRPRRPSPPRCGLSVTSHTPSTRPPYATVFGSGLAGGCLGGLVGLGGGAIMVPMMTAFAGFTQHAAVGTSSAAVASTGLAGCFSFASSGKVDFMAAGAIASTAMVGARFGARFTSRFNQTQLQRTFAVFQLVVAPLVPIKGYLVRQSKVEGHTLQSTADPPQLSAVQMAKLAAIGLCSGVASGMFGIGGGVVITPALCLLTDMQHATVLGTTLTSMAPPGVVSAVTHHRMGNVTVSAVLPLCVGSACGALLGGQLAVHSPSEEPLQLIFALVIAAMGGHKLWALRGKV